MREIWFALMSWRRVAGALPAAAQAPAPDPARRRPIGRHPTGPGARQTRRADHDRRICLDDLSALRPFRQGRIAGPEEEIDRDRQGKAGDARLSARSRWHCGPQMMARCLPPERYYPLVETCSRPRTSGRWQKDWRAALERTARLAGVSGKEFDACLANKALEDQMSQSRLTATTQLDVNATPTLSSTARSSRARRRRRRSNRCCRVWRNPDRHEMRDESLIPAGDAGRAPPPRRVQIVRRADRAGDRAGTDRHRRAERLRQVQPRRGAALGDGRSVGQAAARRRDGRRDLRRLRQPAGAQPRRGRADHRQRRARRAGAFNERRRSRSRAASCAAPARPTGSTDARCAPATCSCCSPMPRPGPHSGALVGQGRIGALIAAKPSRAARAARRGGRHRRAARAAPRGRTENARRRRQSGAARRRDRDAGRRRSRR